MAEEQITFKQIAEEITARAVVDGRRLDGAKYPHTTTYNDFKNNAWHMGKPAPHDKMQQVFAIFRGDELARIYVLPTGQVEGKPEKVPTRFVLYSKSAAAEVEQMSLELFKSEIVDELVTLYREYNPSPAPTAPPEEEEEETEEEEPEDDAAPGDSPQ